MNKITKNQIQEYVNEVGEFEKEHRKYSTFYCWSTYTFTQEDVDYFAKEDVDASEFLGVTVTMSGLWDDSNGSDWVDVEYHKLEPYQELVPEHYVTKYNSVTFKPEWC